MRHTPQDPETPITGIFNDSFPPIIDGVTLTVENYARVLRRHELNPCVVTPWNPETIATDYPVMRYFSLPIRSRHPYRYGYPKLDPFIWRKLRTTPFRLIHSHCPFSSGRLGIYAARHHRVPMIATFHSKYRTDLEHSFRKTPWMVDIVMKRILAFFNSCDHVWIPQAAVEPTVREYGFEGRLTVVENGNDMASRYAESEVEGVKRSARETFGIADDEIALLFVGQHIREKGIGVIAEALTMLPGDVKFRMDYIGTGYALGELRKYVDEHGLTKRVTIHGPVTDRDELCRRYAAADLFLFPSCYDNAPLVVREAAAMKTPAVVVEGSTASEVIRDGENGFTARRTPEDYAALIARLSRNRAAIEHAATGARRTLTRTWDDVVAEVIERYDDIIKEYSVNNR